MNKPNVVCGFCESPFYKKPSLILSTQSGKHYCCRACKSDAAFAAQPKYTTLKCGTCGSNVEKLTCKLKHHKTDVVFCNSECKALHVFDNKQSGVSKIADRTVSDCLRYKGSSKYVLIRANAKVVTKSRPKSCVVCGYDKHVEVCHIRAISDFPLTATVGEVNDSSNLVLLCPNHHWELDKGLLSTSLESNQLRDRNQR